MGATGILACELIRHSDAQAQAARRINQRGKTVDELTAYKNHLAEMAKLGSALSLLAWDQHTHMPKKGTANRSQVMGKLSKMQFERLISPELGRYLEALRTDDSLSPVEKASVYRVGKQYDRNKAIPPALVEEFTMAQSEAQSAWVEARSASDFALFRPHLEKMVSYSRTFADYYGYEKHPYDALIEDYEPGMTSEQLRTIIEPLRRDLVPFLRRLQEDGEPPDISVISGSYDVAAQRDLSQRALRMIGYDFEAGALDDVAHPFTITIGPGDVRVTNRYLEDAVLSGLFAALHEGGHALYNQGMGPELYALHLNNGASNGIHESQSRMIENQVGRSRPFWGYFKPTLVDVFPSFSKASTDALYRAANVVSPSLIRVEADEVTYNLHIMLRFELEVGLIEGSIDVGDLPRLWNDAMERYLGVVPDDDAQGVLQDVHWSMGSFGYFPSYMLGNLYAAQLYAKMKQDIPVLDDQILRGEFQSLLSWLRENIHRHGAVMEPVELIETVTGAPLSARHFLDYITSKYADIYRL